MFLGPLLFVLLVVAAIVVVTTTDSRPQAPVPPSALRVLDERLAGGEIGVEEHTRRREAILERSGDLAPGGPRLTAAILIAAALVVVGWGGWWVGSGHMRGWDGAMAGHMGWAGDTTDAPTAAGAPEVTVEAGELWFAPDRIEVAAGQPVNLVLDNAGAVFHDLSVPAADLVLSAEAGERAVGALRIDTPGTYEFRCTVPGHGDAGMRGTVVVSG